MMEDTEAAPPAIPEELAKLLEGKPPKDAARIRANWLRAEAIRKAGVESTPEVDEFEVFTPPEREEEHDENPARSLADLLLEMVANRPTTLSEDERARASGATLEAAEVAARRNPLGPRSTSLWDDDEEDSE